MVKRSRESSFSPPSNASTTSSRPSSAQGAASQLDHDTSLPAIKYTQLDDTTGPEAVEVMRCSLPPHSQSISFASYEEYEVHYAKAHVNRCSECRKNFPTEHFLNLHIQENHDSLQEARKARGEKTYACFVETCDRCCSSDEKRKRHLIDKHMFPRDYDFNVVSEGIDKRTSLLRQRHRRRSSAATHASQSQQRSQRRSIAGEPTTQQTFSDLNVKPFESGASGSTTSESANGGMTADYPASAGKEKLDEKTSADQEMADLTSSLSALRFVPPSVRFGRGKKAGFSDR